MKRTAIALLLIFSMLFPMKAFAETKYGNGTEKLPSHYYDECPERGTYQLFTDETTKQLINVYLPYGYENDIGRKYDVFFMLHQAGAGNHSSWIETPVQSYGGVLPLKQVYDWLIYEKKIPPIIVACIDLDINRDDRENIRNGMHWIGDNLRTYAVDGTDEELSKARYHFSTGGLSMGGWKGSKCMREDYDIFGNFILGYGGDTNYCIKELSKEYSLMHDDNILNNVVICCGKEDISFNSNKAAYYLYKTYANNCAFYQFQGGHGFASVIPFMYDALQFIYRDYGKAAELYNSLQFRETAEKYLST